MIGPSVHTNNVRHIWNTMRICWKKCVKKCVTSVNRHGFENALLVIKPYYKKGKTKPYKHNTLFG